MKLIKFLFVAFVALPGISLAQKSGLINSGEILKQGSILHDSTQYKKALALYDKVSRSDTNYVRTLYEKALTCQADSQFTQAIKYCKEALSLKEQRDFESDLYNVYGTTLNAMGQSEGALKVFDQAIAKFPASPLLYYNKGVTYSTLKQWDKAEELFKKTLLVNPYMFSAHYQLGLAALYQGKIIPAYLSVVGYLLVSPQGRFASQAIGLLSQMSKGTDEILEFKAKRTVAPGPNYEMAEEIFLSKIALDKQYKPIIALDDQISRQIQVLFEKLEYNAADADFWNQYYLPYYKQVYKNGRFEPFINHLFMGVNIEPIQSYIKRNKKLIETFETEAGTYFNQLRATRELMYTRRDTITKQYLYDNGVLLGYGALVDNGKTLSGHWIFSYPAGNLKSEGEYAAGKREGNWKFYHSSGAIKSYETYKNGELDGPVTSYYDNGVLSATENYVKGQSDGLTAIYYYGGNKKILTHYKAGKKDGEERTFYSNGNLKAINNYNAGVLSGLVQEYHKNGQLKNTANYVAGKMEGPYKVYHENGALSAEMPVVNDAVVGEWKSYYNTGKLKEKRNYTAKAEDGPHQEYHENGKLATNYTVIKDKINGIAEYYDNDGALYAKYTFDNGVIKSTQFLSPDGKQLGASTLKGGFIDVTSYMNGYKKAHFRHDQKGKLAGVDTLFYPSGKVFQIVNYKDDNQNGPVITYHLNGQKKSEINYTNGQEDGYYQSFHPNGQPEIEGWVVNGAKQGEWVLYDVRGKVSNKTNYLDDELHGYKQDFDGNGNLHTEFKYDYSLLDKITHYDPSGKILAVDEFPKANGTYRVLSAKGQVIEQAGYSRGNLHGAYKTFYIDGSVESSFFYKNGMVDSTYVNYYHGGQKHNEGTYKNGEKAGTWKNYNDDGTLYSVAVYDNFGGNQRTYYNSDGTKDRVGDYKENDLNGLVTKYDNDGTIAYLMRYEDDLATAYSYIGKDGKPIPFINITSGHMQAYYPNGKLSRECDFEDGTKKGELKLYYANGQLSVTDVTKLGLNQGPTREFYPNGKMESELLYVDGQLDGLAREFYKDGTLKKEAMYVNGYNHGPVKYYNAQGKLVKTLQYEYDNIVAIKNEK